MSREELVNMINRQELVHLSCGEELFSVDSRSSSSGLRAELAKMNCGSSSICVEGRARQ